MRTLYTIGTLWAFGCSSGGLEHGNPGFHAETKEEPLQDDAGSRPIEPETPPEQDTDAATQGPCVEVSGPVLRRWPLVADRFAEAADRWGFTLPLGYECKLVLYLDRTTAWARTEALGGEAAIWLNPDADIVDGLSCLDEMRLVDVLTHELGHVAGLPESECSDCAMGPAEKCRDVLPTNDEKAAVSR